VLEQRGVASNCAGPPPLRFRSTLPSAATMTADASLCSGHCDSPLFNLDFYINPRRHLRKRQQLRGNNSASCLNSPSVQPRNDAFTSMASEGFFRRTPFGCPLGALFAIIPRNTAIISCPVIQRPKRLRFSTAPRETIRPGYHDWAIAIHRRRRSRRPAPSAALGNLPCPTGVEASMPLRRCSQRRKHHDVNTSQCPTS